MKHLEAAIAQIRIDENLPEKPYQPEEGDLMSWLYLQFGRQTLERVDVFLGTLTEPELKGFILGKQTPAQVLRWLESMGPERAELTELTSAVLFSAYEEM